MSYVHYVRVDEATGVESYGMCPAADIEKQRRPGKRVILCDSGVHGQMVRAALKDHKISP